MLHRKMTPVLRTEIYIFRNRSSFRVTALGKKPHEISASWNCTFLGYTSNIFGEVISVRMARKTRDDYTILFLGFNFRDKKCPILSSGGWVLRKQAFTRFRRIRVANADLSDFFALTKFRGGSSVSSSRPIICVPKRTH